MGKVVLVVGRSIDTVTAEIVALSDQAAQNAYISMVEIGKRLCEAKELVQHGEWESYIKNEVPFSQRTASNFMQIYKNHQANPNSQAFANLSYSKIVKLLAMPEDDREALMENVDVAQMSARELERVIKERDEARAAEQQAVADAGAVKDQLQKVQTQLSAAQQAITKAKDGEQKAKDALKDYKKNPAIPPEKMEELKNEALASVQGDIDAANARAAKAEADAQAARNQLASSRKDAMMADPDVTAFRVALEQLGTMFNQTCGYLVKIRGKNPEMAVALNGALLKGLRQMEAKVQQ